MKLSFKLWIYFIVSSIVAVVLFAALALALGKIYHKGYSNNALKVIANQLIDEVKLTGVTPSVLHPIMEQYQSKNPAIDFEWFRADGSIVYSSNGRTKPYSFSEYSDLFVNEPENMWTPGQSINLIYPADIAGKPYYLHFHVPDSAMKSSQVVIYFREYSAFISLVIPFLVFLFTPYFFTYRFFASLRKRLKKLNEGLSETTLDQQREILDSSKDEIGQLTRHFNTMSKRIHEQMARIQEQETKRKTLISNLSHDLRTPLTNILGYAETVQKGIYKNQEELHAHCEVIVHRSQYMEKLINTLFEVSQYDLHGIKVMKESCHLAGLLRKTMAEYIPVLELKGMTTDISIPDTPVTLMLDPHLMERALRNLLDNAIHYGASGHYLGVEYKEEDKLVAISIIDRGKGIPAEQQPLLFDRFFQGSQNRNSEGFGLGLSIVKEIATAHDGDVIVTSVPNQETRFTLILPR